MAGLLYDIMLWTLSYLMVLIIGFGIVQFLSNGFFGTFIRVKASRGKLVLVRLHSVLGVYYRAGKLDENVLRFKNRAKNKKGILIEKKSVYRHIGVNNVDIDDDHNNVLDPINWTILKGWDAVKYDHLLQRALARPNVHSNQEKIILILVILGFLANVVIIYLIYNIYSQISGMTGTIR